jgi:hypothetical protein
MHIFVNIWKAGKPEKSERISFATPELLWRVLTQNGGSYSKLFAEPVPYLSGKSRFVSGAILRPSMEM